MFLHKMNVAIVYDRVNKWGGAEKVLLALNELFPKAPLYTAVYSPERAIWAKTFPEVIPTFLQKIPFLNGRHELLGALTPIAFETLDMSAYDMVISVTSEAAKGVLTKPTTKHICYCLTPTRYLWSGYNEYLDNPPKQFKMIPYFAHISQPLLKYVRKWDIIASTRPDVMVAISRAVQDRIKLYYKRESELIYPPVDVDKFKTEKSNINKKRMDVPLNKYYIAGGRLVPYKKIDLVIETFNDLGKRLVVFGTGSDERYLKKIAKSNIEFTGHVTDEKVVALMHSAKALIYPQEEDFGITAVEAQAAGVPVVAYKKGGATDTVLSNRTGVFFEKQTKMSLSKAIKKLEQQKYNKSVMVKNAQRFSKERFKKDFDDLVQRVAK